MHPKLVEIPFVHLTIWSFGAMMALGFLLGVFVVRRLSRKAGLDPELMLNATFYALIVGILGARLFFVVHHHDEVSGGLLGWFAIWQGGLEFLGGVVPALLFVLWYWQRHKIPLLKALDIIAIALMVGLSMGRIGCFLNGCCFGKPTESCCAVQFPYESYAYQSQIRPNVERGRNEPHLELPMEYYVYDMIEGRSIYQLKPFDSLTPEQQEAVTHGEYRCLPVYPTQLFASAGAMLIAGLLYGVWLISQRRQWTGQVFCLATVLYGVMRFILESLRDDNPYEILNFTISQLLSMVLVAIGLTVWIACQVILKKRNSPVTNNSGDGKDAH